MKWCLRKILLAAGLAALTSQAALAEETHNSGGTFNLSRPSASSSSGNSAKRLSELVNACSVRGTGGFGAGLLGNGVNPGLSQIGQGVGAGGTGLTAFPTGGAGAGTGAGARAAKGGTPAAGALGLFQAKCTSCHGPKDPQRSILAIQGQVRVPADMQAALGRISAQDKQAIIGFLQTR